jgi:hypothetical protein
VWNGVEEDGGGVSGSGGVRIFGAFLRPIGTRVLENLNRQYVHPHEATELAKTTRNIVVGWGIEFQYC